MNTCPQVYTAIHIRLIEITIYIYIYALIYCFGRRCMRIRIILVC